MSFLGGVEVGVPVLTDFSSLTLNFTSFHHARPDKRQTAIFYQRSISGTAELPCAFYLQQRQHGGRGASFILIHYAGMARVYHGHWPFCGKEQT